jgi:hypothetical protein
MFERMVIYSLESDGRSKGLVIGWRGSLEFITQSFINAGIQKKIRSQEMGKDIGIINHHGPYGERKYFWNPFNLLGFVRKKNVILGGDLNLTMKV